MIRIFVEYMMGFKGKRPKVWKMMRIGTGWE
ncbi:hypothetical protein EDC14_102832 [Hydrogenispora ethanolica]|uniref:Uncharacterized protein n=1 Tax=Hydrogenispora ethanolica TaxID=1082276 RepID=A0A4R1R8U1_HYDET|nr:hypothetical protein EDC14_102832 [Hydrogenispora ethanolica]